MKLPIPDNFTTSCPPMSPATQQNLALACIRESQSQWASQPMAMRLAVIRRLRHGLALHASELCNMVRLPPRPESAVTLASEVLPLAEACRFLETNAPRILRPQKHTSRGQSLWLRGHRLEIHHEPLGVVLILGPSNYPLLLPGVQAIQALVAGNAVILKPGSGGRPCMQNLGQLLHEAGLPPHLFCVLDESVETARSVLQLPIDKVFLTGSAATGRQVLSLLAEQLTPAVMELSGCDAVFVREDADLDLVVRATTFGLTLNGSATCIAPRRLFVHQKLVQPLSEKLVRALRRVPAVPVSAPVGQQVIRLVNDALKHGATPLCWSEPVDNLLQPVLLGNTDPEMELLQSDVFAPVLALVAVSGDDQALRLAQKCPYALGATVFGSLEKAQALAQKVDAGCVVINDMIAPTADPRLPFAGRHRSGFGVTRGAMGLLAMTVPKAIVVTHGKFKPHLQPPQPDDAAMLQAYLRLSHAVGWRKRWTALVDLLGILIRRSRKRPSASRQEVDITSAVGRTENESSTNTPNHHPSGRINP